MYVSLHPQLWKSVKSLMQIKPFFVPDPNLGHYVAEQIPEKEFAFYTGGCPRHMIVTPEHVRKAKELHPNALLLVHPECRQEVVARQIMLVLLLVS